VLADSAERRHDGARPRAGVLPGVSQGSERAAARRSARGARLRVRTSLR